MATTEPGKIQPGEVVSTNIMLQSTTSISVSFTADPPSGFVGVCTDPACAPYTVTRAQLGTTYDASIDYFVFYSTAECFRPGGFYEEDINTYLVSYFTWLYNPKPAKENVVYTYKAPKATYPVDLIFPIDPPCGWPGICQTGGCAYDGEVLPAMYGFVYNGETEIVTFYTTPECFDEDDNITDEALQYV